MCFGNCPVTVGSMKSYEATALVEANPEAIWAILTDAPGLSRWDSGIDRVEGRIAPGETIKLFSKLTSSLWLMPRDSLLPPIDR